MLIDAAAATNGLELLLAAAMALACSMISAGGFSEPQRNSTCFGPMTAAIVVANRPRRVKEVYMMSNFKAFPISGLLWLAAGQET